MNNKNDFLKMIIDSMTEHIVVIDTKGSIQFVNKSWSEFGACNACTIIGENWVGKNYIDECEKAELMGDDFGSLAKNGISTVIDGQEELYALEYPCHSPVEKRWFMMRVTPFSPDSSNYFVISHQNITARKLAEEKAENLARIDGLTDLANRRAFDEFLDSEFKRCKRLKSPLSLIIIDLDHFKLLNDTYGHQAGDDCLIEVGKVLKEFNRRPSDISARYGGEEFAIIWGNTPLKQARAMSHQLLDRIADLRIPNEKSSVGKYLTASIGIASLVPGKDDTIQELVEKADSHLYRAKETGRSKVVSE